MSDWEIAILKAVNSLGGKEIGLREIYGAVPNFIELKAKHLEKRKNSGVPAYQDQVRGYINKYLWPNNDLDRAGRGTYSLTKKGLKRIAESNKLQKITTIASSTESRENKIAKEISHEEIQWLLLKLGSDSGLDVWVARNDRSKEFNGNKFNDINRLKKELPRQFDEATNRTIELIDVIWLQDNSIFAAFEVEHTTSIHSGLLRMSDLISMQPNITIKLYIVAPDERREKVLSEINRPTFAKLKQPLSKLCKFLAYSKLKREIEQLGNKVKHMLPEFIDGIAETRIHED